MALFNDILSGNWVTGLAIGVGAVVVLPLAAPILRPLAKTAIKGGIQAPVLIAAVDQDACASRTELARYQPPDTVGRSGY